MIKKTLYTFLLSSFVVISINAMEENSFIEEDDVGEQLVQAINNFKGLSFIEKLIKQKQNARWMYPHLVYVAAKRGDVRVVKLLLSYSFSINAQGNSKKTPLYAAVKRNNKKLVTLLLDNSADINSGREVFRGLKWGGSWVWLPPIFLAIECHQPKMVDILIERGAYLGPNYNGETPLMRAVKSDFTYAVGRLLEKGNQFINECDYDNNTALSIAFQTQKMYLASILLDSGARIELVKVPPLISMTKNPMMIHFHELEELIKKGANISDTDWNEKTVIDHLSDDIEYRKSILEKLKNMQKEEAKANDD